MHFSFQEALSIFQNMGGQHCRLGLSMALVFTESEFSLDRKLSTGNVSIGSFLKLQLSRLFLTRSVVFLHFDMASESTGTAGSLSKVEKKSRFKV